MPGRRTNSRNGGKARLEEAMENLLLAQTSLAASHATLIANQAAFQANMTALNARNEERFERIEAELADIRAILLRHEQILQSLPEAIRQKIGFDPR